MARLGIIKIYLTQLDISDPVMFVSPSISIFPTTTFLFPFTLLFLGAPGSGAVKFSPSQGDCLVEKRTAPLHDSFGSPQAFMPPPRLHTQLQLNNLSFGFPLSQVSEQLQPSSGPYSGPKKDSTCCPFMLYLLYLQHGSLCPNNYNINLIYQLVF